MERRIKIIVVLLIGVSEYTFSQAVSTLSLQTSQSKEWRIANLFQSQAIPIARVIKMNPANAMTGINTRLAPDYYVQHFGFFCKNEYRFEKFSKLPLRFRIGSLDYCNKLESK